MKVTFLGTGTSQGVPLIACHCEVCVSQDARDKRLRSAVMITINGKNYVIDSGPDFRQQMLRENIDDVEAIIFTHEHKDHIAGLDDVRGFNFRHNRYMQVYATKRVQEAIKREFSYVFAEYKYPGIPLITLNTIDHTPFTIDEVLFTPIQVMHAKMPVFGFRIGDFTYITDANYIGDAEKEKIKGSKVLVLNALRREEHISHFTLQQAIDLVNELKPEKAYFTHISHQLGLHTDVNAELPKGMELAYDGLLLEV